MWESVLCGQAWRELCQLQTRFWAIPQFLSRGWQVRGIRGSKRARWQYGLPLLASQVAVGMDSEGEHINWAYLGTLSFCPWRSTNSTSSRPLDLQLARTGVQLLAFATAGPPALRDLGHLGGQPAQLDDVSQREQCFPPFPCMPKASRE